MKKSRLGRFKDLLLSLPSRSRSRSRSSNASHGQAARMPQAVPAQEDSSAAANVSQESTFSTDRAPNSLTEQSQASGSIHSVTPSLPSNPAATPTPSPSQTTVLQPQPGQPGQPGQHGQSLWDRAYEALRADDSQLLDRYEKLLSTELPESVISPDPLTRQNQLKKITDRAMERADEKRTKYSIFGHEFVLKDQVSQATKFVKAMKDFVDEAVKVSPEASLAWAGVCVLLPVFTNPSAADEANRDGLSYVASRIRYYVELERLLWPENLESQDLRGEIESHIVDLYQEILKFQIKTVFRFHRKWLANVGRDVISSDNWKGMVSRIKELEQTVRDESRTVNTIASRKRIGEIHDAAKQQDNKLQSLLSVAKDQLQVSTEQLAEQKRTNQILEGRPIDLDVVYEACYDSADVQDSPKCDDGTRIRIKDIIDRWAEEDSEETLLWLVGPAGTGKSTIARTVADSFARTSRLAAGYFFKRGQQGRNDTSRLIPTLAVQMTQTIPSFKQCLAKHLDGMNKDAVEKKALEFQFDKLIRLPLADLPPTATRQLPRVIIIDALDECERPEHLAGILRLLCELRNITEMGFRVMLTSRSAPSIADAFDPLLKNKTARRLETHREFFDDTKKDIRIFLEANFANIRMKFRIQQNPWPLAEDMDRLVELATSPEPLFIYAATLCRFVYNPNKPRNPENHPKRQLDQWLEQCKDSKSQIQQIYEPILDQIFTGNNKEGSDQQLLFLGALVLLANPLSILSLAGLFAVDTDAVTWWLLELHAVLDIPSEPHKPLRLLHRSFSDFLLDSDGPYTSLYRVDVASTHSLLAEKCVQRMEAGLKQDICDVRALDANLNEIRQEEIDRCIPEDLKYACLYWVYHLQGSGQPPGTDIHTFLRKHFLNWLEVLSLLGRLSDGGLAIRKLLELIKRFPDTPLEFVDLVKDVRRVISSFGSMIERTPLQTYGSLLFFTPVASQVRQIFWDQRMPKFDPIQGVKLDWDSYLQTLKGHDGYISTIAFSPDSQVIASGSLDHNVQLWSATTGAHLQTLEGHSDAVDVVVFSDNDTLASGSRDGTVRIWNISTGRLLQTLSEIHGRISAIVFLPDGEHLATASTIFQSEVSVQLWNLKTGALPKGLFQRYSDMFREVAFSPDSQLMASSMSNNTIWIWSFPNGSHPRPLRGHREPITAMVFSLNNQLLASGSSDSTLRLWNIKKGVQIYAFESYPGEGLVIAFSPDCRLLASSWSGHDVRILNVVKRTHQAILPGHSHSVLAVAFSPDGQLLASGSYDETIKLWDAEMYTDQPPVDRYTDTGRITKVVFSPDGQLVASSSRDRRVRLWDVSTGLCLRVLDEHNYWVHDVTFSPDGKLLASFVEFFLASSVRIWNVENGMLEQKIDRQSGLVTAVGYSTDGQLAASASSNTVTLYDAATGVGLFKLDGCGDSVERVVFSPNSKFLASLSRDKTITLWETNTGMLRHVLGDGNICYGLVFSPNSQFLASVQWDSIVFWNVMSGAKQQTLEVGVHISGITLSPDDRLLAIQTDDFDEQQVIDLWDMTTGKSLHTLPILAKCATDILFSPDSQVVAVAAQDRTVKLWFTMTDGPYVYIGHLLTIENPNDFVTKIKFSPNGQTLATASRDKAVRLWDTTTGSHLQMIQYGAGFVREINFLTEVIEVLESSDENAWSWNLSWTPKTLKVHKFPFTAAPQIGSPEPNMPEINLDADEEWITKDSKRLVWLPPQYRPTAWARKGSTIFIGCDSGRVLRVQDV